MSTFFTDQHRCVVLAYKKLVQGIKITDSVFALIKKTMFSHFYDLPPCNISTYDLTRLLNQTTLNNRFYIGNQIFDFQVSDVSDVLSIPNRGINIDEKNKPTPPTQLLNLFGEDRPTRWKLESIYDRISKGEIQVDDVLKAQLWLISLFTTVLLPDSTTGIDEMILYYIGDLDKLGDYNWAEYVHRVIFDGVQSSRKYCIGCAWALLVSNYV